MARKLPGAMAARSSATMPCGSSASRTKCSIDSIRTPTGRDRKSTRLNSSHTVISYAVFCLKKKIKTQKSTLMAELNSALEVLDPQQEFRPVFLTRARDKALLGGRDRHNMQTLPRRK